MVFSNQLRYRAVRHYGDARNSSFDSDCDRQVDSFLKNLRSRDPIAFRQLLVQAHGTLANSKAWAEKHGHA
jgi:hypothetical protein